MACLIIKHIERVDGTSRKFGYGVSYDELSTDELADRVTECGYYGAPDPVDRTVTVDLGELSSEQANAIHQELFAHASRKSAVASA